MHTRLLLFLLLFLVSCTELNSILVTSVHHFCAFHIDQQQSVPVNITTMSSTSVLNTNFVSHQIKLDEKSIKLIKWCTIQTQNLVGLTNKPTGWSRYETTVPYVLQACIVGIQCWAQGNARADINYDDTLVLHVHCTITVQWPHREFHTRTGYGRLNSVVWIWWDHMAFTIYTSISHTYIQIIYKTTAQSLNFFTTSSKFH